MSYQFDVTRLSTDSTAKLRRDVATSRLLARRTARQARRDNRAV